MGMRFRKSWNVGGLRVNLSKKGIGGSVGVKGARYTVKSGGGTRTTVGIPGTGLSYVKDSSGNKAPQSCGCRSYASSLALAFVLKFIGFLTIVFGVLLALALPVVGIAVIALGICERLAGRGLKKRVIRQAAEEAALQEEEEAPAAELN